MRVAVVGKGGAGKSLVAGTMARLLARRGHPVLALDSDPMPGLAISLGLGPLTTPMLTDAAVKDDEGRWRLKKGVGPATAVRRHSTAAPDGVRLLQFGKPNGAGMAPLMGSLNAFYQVAHRLGRDRVMADWSIVGDLPAGPRQAAFNWAPYADVFLVVAEPTWQSALTARRIARIARTRPGVAVYIVANRIDAASQVALLEQRLREQILSSIPADASVREAERHGRALLDHAPHSKAVDAIDALLDKLERTDRR